MRALLGALFLAACSADSFIAADADPPEEAGHFGAPILDGGLADGAFSSEAGLSDAFAADAGSDADPPPADASWADSADSGSGWTLGDLAYCSGISCAWAAWPLTQGEPAGYACVSCVVSSLCSPIPWQDGCPDAEVFDPLVSAWDGSSSILDFCAPESCPPR